MSEKIAIFEDLDDLANFTAGRSAGLISGATDKMCVSKGNFDIISSITIADEGNGLMFVEGSESYNYAPERLIQLKDVQYISEITATLVSAPNILSKGGSSYATWELTQYYKAGNASSVSKKEWSVDGTTVSSNSKGTTESAETDVEKSIATVESYGKTIMLSQMIKQDSNTVKLGIWSTPTVTVSPSSIESKGGNSSISISGNPQRIKEWSSGATSVDEAEISKVSATFGTVSSDFTTLTVGVNENVSTRSGKVSVEWVYNNDVVKIVDSNEYKQQSQSSCEMTLKSSSVAYHGKAYVVGNASVDGKIWWGEDSANMNNYTEVYANIDVNIIERTSLGKTIIYAYFVPSDENIAPLGNKNQYYASAAAEITKASDASLTLSVYNRNYNGSAQMVAECGEPHGVSSWGIGYSKSGVSTITWVDNKNLSLTDAGTYDIWVKWTADNNHSNNESGKYTGQSVTINKAGVTVTAPTAKTLTYTGYAQALLNAGSGSPVGTMYYGTKNISYNSTDWSKTIPSQTNAGSYTVYYYYKVDDTANYKANSGSTINAPVPVSTSIAKAIGSIDVSIKNPTYTGSAVNIATATATGAYYLGIGSSDKSAPSSWTKNAALTATNAGTYHIWAKCDAGTNHNAVNQYYVGTATITAAGEASVIVTPKTGITYNGSAQQLTTVEANGVSTWTLGYATSSSSTSPTWLNSEKTNLSLTNAGTYYIWVKWQPDSNHTGGSPNGEKTGKIVTINKREVKITDPTKTNWTYSGSAYTIFAAGSCTPGGVMYYSDTDKEFSTSTWSKSPLPSTYTQKTNAGTYILYYYCYVSDIGNNTGTNINKILSISATINKKATTAPTLTAGYKTTYDGSVVYAKAASASGNPAGKIYYGSSSGATTYNIIASTTATNLTEMGQTNVGKKDIYAFFRPNDTNYADSSVVSTTVEVKNKRTVTITKIPTAKTLTYTGSAQTLLNAGTCSSGGTMYYGLKNTSYNTTDWSPSIPTKTDAGTYTVYYMCHVADTNNNTAGTGVEVATSVSVTISKRNVTYKATDQSKTYDGSALNASNTADLTAGTLVSEHTATFSCSGSITNYAASGATKTLSSVTIKSGSTDVTSNYNITKNNGKLTIDRRNVTFKAVDESVEYTGSLLSASDTAKLTSGTLVDGHEATFTCSGLGKDINEYTKSILTVTIMSGSTDVTSNYKITKESGKFVITQRIVKITAPTATNCTYSGSAQTIFAAGSCTTGGTMYYSDIYQEEFSTSTWSKSPLPSTYTQKTDAGTYTLYYYCYVSDIGNNTGTNINKILSISATINKKSATILFAGSNLTVQCKNSATSLDIATNVRYLAATVTGGSVSYTIDSIQNPSGVTGTFISESQTALQLKVAIGTPVGDYSVNIKASQSNPNYTSTPVTRTYKISVLPDTLGDYTGTLSISNPSTKLSAGDDTRTITWGAIHQVWKHGGNTVYMPSNANLTVSCNDSTAKKYVSINRNSYVNSSDTTTTTLTKTTYSSVYEHSIGATFTLELRTYDGKIIQTLDIAANPNNKIHTLEAVNLSYSVAGSTSGSTNIPSVTYDTTYGYQSGAVISTTTGNTSPTLDDNTTFTKSFEEYQSNGYASFNASTGVVTWNSSNPSSTERKMTVKCTGVLDSKGITSSKSVIAEAKQSDTSKSIRVSYVNRGCPYGCSYRVLAKTADLTTIQYGSATGNFHTETYGISELTVVAYATNQSGSSKTLTLTWSGGGGTSTMIGTGVSSASRSTLSITVPNGTYQGSNEYYIAVTLTSTGNMSGSIQFSLS